MFQPAVDMPARWIMMRPVDHPAAEVTLEHRAERLVHGGSEPA